jgi:antitoxin component HigA of HigAB toxin-antitoxin module
MSVLLDAAASELPVLDYDPTVPEIHSAGCAGGHDAMASCPGKPKETPGSCKKASASALSYDPFSVHASAPAFSRADLRELNASAQAIRASEKLAAAAASYATPDKVAAVKAMLSARKKKTSKTDSYASADKIAAVRAILDAQSSGKKERMSSGWMTEKTPSKNAKSSERYASADKIAAVRAILAADAAAAEKKKESYASAEKVAAVLARAEELAAERYASPEKIAAVRAILDQHASTKMKMQGWKPSKVTSASAAAPRVLTYAEDVSHLIM